MVDARLPERYLMDRRLARLSPEDFRGFVFATLWSVSNRTDGVILDDEVRIVPWLGQDMPGRLVEAGVWDAIEGGWMIADFGDVQTSKHDLEVLDNARRRDRDKKARQRAAKLALDPVPGDAPGELSPGTTQARPGKARPGEEAPVRFEESSGEVASGVPAGVASWEVAKIPTGRSCEVCSSPLPEGFPLAVCARQDDAH